MLTRRECWRCGHDNTWSEDSLITEERGQTTTQIKRTKPEWGRESNGTQPPFQLSPPTPNPLGDKDIKRDCRAACRGNEDLLEQAWAATKSILQHNTTSAHCGSSPDKTTPSSARTELTPTVWLREQKRGPKQLYRRFNQQKARQNRDHISRALRLGKEKHVVWI